MVGRNYIADIEKALQEKKKPTELLSIILGFLNFKAIEIKIYNLLLKSSMSIKQIEKQLNISERTVRKYIKRLDEERLINKRVEQGERLKYLYSSIPVKEAWKKVKGEIQRILDEINRVLQRKSVLI